jgi:hypothetical protein
MSALDNFKHALAADVDRFRGMDNETFIAACLAICDEQDDFDPDVAVMADVLFARAQQGSIEAGAALFVMTEGTPGWADCVVEALGGTARRSEDLTHELQYEAMVMLLEEHCEEEIAAGRMRKITDPAGKTQYQIIPPGEQRT